MKSVSYKFYENYMIIVGSLSSMVFYLQAYEVAINKSAHDVSLVAFICGLISVISWLIYGVLLKNKPLIASNALAVIGASLAVIFIILYS